MDVKKIRDKAAAEKKLAEFSENTLQALVKILIERKEDFREEIAQWMHSSTWCYAVYANCMSIHYGDGEQERKSFYVPSIDICFDPKLDIRREVIERLPLGFCSCGKPIPIAQHLLSVSDGLESKCMARRFIARINSLILSCRIKFSSKNQLALLYNRHPSCL